MRILFIAGFGPIPDYLLPTKKLYSGDLEIEFHEYEGGYMYAQKLMVAKGLSFASVAGGLILLRNLGLVHSPLI